MPFGNRTAQGSDRCFRFGIALLAVVAGAARADMVTDWNGVALDAIRALPENPPRATRALAMVHVAIHDALNGIDRRFEAYHVEQPGNPAAAPEVAVAVAAHTVLSGLYPQLATTLDEALATSLIAFDDGAAAGAGRAWGRHVGRRILRLRRDDNSDMIVAYEPSGEMGSWQPTPPAMAPALLPQWPYVTPFAMTWGGQFRPAPVPALDSADFATAYNEVKDLGGVGSALRDADQTEIAYFWEDGAGTVTPPGHWQVIAAQIAERHGNDPWENARLFALLSIAQADAAIMAWDCKYGYDHVRPYTHIVSTADHDGNDDTVTDPTWLPLIPTPPFPSYTSGHSSFSSASATVLAAFLGSDEIVFCGESPDPGKWPEVLPGVVRCWDRFSEASEEAGQSRIYGGIHWQYDNQAGLESGAALGAYVYENFLRPLD
jgi:membrane-associated phospholipid phosphatase